MARHELVAVVSTSPLEVLMDLELRRKELRLARGESILGREPTLSLSSLRSLSSLSESRIKFLCNVSSAFAGDTLTLYS